MNTFKYDICEALELDYGKTIQEASTVELYDAVSKAMMKAVAADWRKPYEGKQACYFSAEFLIGKLLSNNLINLGLYEQISQELEENGKNIAQIEEAEPEPSLGNGGLGRLAACFLDSIATLNLNGDGIGINYHLGLFRQVFAQNKQTEHFRIRYVLKSLRNRLP